jgi:hypothetical protein
MIVTRASIGLSMVASFSSLLAGLGRCRGTSWRGRLTRALHLTRTETTGSAAKPLDRRPGLRVGGHSGFFYSIT